MNFPTITKFTGVFPLTERTQPQEQQPAVQPQEGDVINVRPAARLLEDNEWEGVLDESISMIGANPFEAMHVHGGLDANRVAALLA